MANIASPYSTYSDTTPQKRIISDVITMISPYDTPFLDVIGGLDGGSGKFKFIGKGKKVEWMEDTLTPLSGTFSLAAVDTSYATALTVLDGNMLQPGHILLTANSELLWVSAVTPSTGAITVTRNLGGASASIATTAAFSIVGMARLEGDDSDSIGFTDISTNYNYTQIFHKEIKITETERVIDNYGFTDAYQYQAAKSMPEMMRLIELSILNGTRLEGSATTPRAFGGYRTFITSNTLSGASMTQATFENAIKLIYQDGGSGKYTAICSPTNMQKVKNFYDTSSFLRVDRTETTVGMRINGIITPFGEVDLVMDRWISDSYIPILDLNNIGMVTLRPFAVEELAKTGDAMKTELVGEFTLAIKANESHALLSGVS